MPVTSLITGATGFLGSRIAHLLHGRGESVRVLVRTTSDRRRLGGLAVEYAEGDVTDRASVEKALDGVDTVYHAAALYEFGTPDPALMERINVGGTANVLEAAHDRSVLAVHVSSVAALGPTGDSPVVEGHWRADTPRSPYEASKKRAHVLAQELAASGARVRIGMPGAIYGPDDPSVLGLAHKLLFRGMPVALGPRFIISFVHVDDCADGLVRVGERGADGEGYILAAQAVTFRHWFETIARVSGHAAPRWYLPDWLVWDVGDRAARLLPGRPGRVLRDALAMSGGENYAFSSERARGELGWEPRSLEEGLADVAGWYRSQKQRKEGA